MISTYFQPSRWLQRRIGYCDYRRRHGLLITKYKNDQRYANELDADLALLAIKANLGRGGTPVVPSGGGYLCGIPDVDAESYNPIVGIVGK